MTRELKVVGLAMAAVLVISMGAASSASAQTNGHITADGPVTLFGTETGTVLQNSLTAYGDAIVCPGSTYTGHRFNTTNPRQLIQAGETNITITPHYKNCKVNSNGLTAHVDMNGCDYQLAIGETTETDIKSDTYGVTASIDCPSPSTHIRITVTFFGVACTTTIPEQTFTGGHLRDTTNGFLDLEGAFTGIKSSRSGFGCETAGEESGVLDTDVTIAARDAEGLPTSVSMSHPPPPPPQTIGHIASDGAATLVGTQTGTSFQNSLTIFGDAFPCEGSTYTGHRLNVIPHRLIQVGETNTTMTPHYKNCKVNSNGLTAHVDMNGCDYALAVGETTETDIKSDTYGVTASIDCPSPSTHINVTVTFFGVACTTTIAEQTLTGGHLRDTTNGFLDLEGAFTGIKSSRSGFGCATESEESGVLHTDLTIAGRDVVGAATPVSITHTPQSPPQTNGHITSDGPVTLAGTQTGTDLQNAWTLYGDSMVCPQSTYTGHKLDSTPHGLIASGETTATVTPHYKDCKMNSSGLTVHIDMNGCDYELTTGLETPAGATDTYGVTTHIDCPTPQQQIAWTVTSSGVACTIKFAEQTIIGGHLRNLTNGHIALEGAFTGIKSSRSGSGCESKSEAEGVTHIDMTIGGRNAAGEVTPVAITD